MDGLDPGKRFIGILEKYKYAIAVAMLGILLMLIPGNKTESVPQETQPEVCRETLEQTLESILSQIQGAGRVEVLLSQQTGEQTLYQTDVDEDSDETGTSHRSQTVIVSDGSRAETGLIQRKDPPSYLGAIIVCQGGDNAQVRLAIVEAVGCVTGLGADQISVLKMK